MNLTIFVFHLCKIFMLIYCSASVLLCGSWGHKGAVGLAKIFDWAGCSLLKCDTVFRPITESQICPLQKIIGMTPLCVSSVECRVCLFIFKHTVATFLPYVVSQSTYSCIVLL